VLSGFGGNSKFAEKIEYGTTTLADGLSAYFSDSDGFGGGIPGEPLRVAQPVVELGGAVLVARVLAAAIAVFLLVTITKFKNLKMQQMLCSVGVLLMLAEIAVVVGGYFMAVVEPRFTMTAPLPVLALACTLMAKSRIQKDYKIIHDCDRLR
jgi:hypothetical protein